MIDQDSLRHRPESIAKIGPNAITRVAEALVAVRGRADDCFSHAGLAHYLAAPPEEMVDEQDVIALQHALQELLDPDIAQAVSLDAGRRTGDYLLARRIPKGVQRLLALLPSGLSARLLLIAVSKHSWTFAGSGHFSYVAGNPVQIVIGNCPVCRGSSSAKPMCSFYAGAFGRLFEVLVNRNAIVQETRCQASGSNSCLFEVAWRN